MINFNYYTFLNIATLFPVFVYSLSLKSTSLPLLSK